MESMQTPQMPYLAEAPEPVSEAPPLLLLQRWRRMPPERRAELIDGRILYQGMPGPRHGRTQGMVFHVLTPFIEDADEGLVKNRQGGWWLSQEVDLYLAGEVLRGQGVGPDVVGWRSAQRPEPPEPHRRGPYKGLVTDVPDWICEVLSRGTARRDMGRKREIYHAAGVGHYWVVDPRSDDVLYVFRRTEAGYTLVQTGAPGDVIRAEPFAAVEIPVAGLFGKRRQAAEARVPSIPTAPET